MKAGGMQPKISVIISSRNRAASLLRCLQYFDAVAMQQLKAELVLVDNGSSDGTFDVMRNFRDHVEFPVAVVREERRGLSNARNTGMALSRGELIVFTDDDCYIAPDFLQTVEKVFSTQAIDYCGGRILLFDESDSHYGCDLNATFHPIPPRTLLDPGDIQGANMIFRRTVINRVGGFDTRLGAGTPFRCEDIDYCTRASWAGFLGAHVPELVVYHHHGRKPGKDIRELERANQYADGAFYAKCFFSGILNAKGCLWILHEQLARIWNESRGAFAFTLLLAKQRFRGKQLSSDAAGAAAREQVLRSELSSPSPSSHT
jgi:GT2 family glycosyltransferase